MGGMITSLPKIRMASPAYSTTAARLAREGASPPDSLLIDGGKKRLSAALDALESLGVDPPCVISLARPQAVGRTVTSAT